MKRLILSLALTIATCTTSFAQEAADTPKATETPKAAESKKADPSGTWKWQRDNDNGTVQLSVKLKLEGDKLTGTFESKWPEGSAFPGANDPVEIEEGKLEGDKISFQVTRKFNENEFVVHFTGKIDGDTISGKQEMEFGNGSQEFEWNPKRSVALDAYAGKWKIAFEGPNGDKMESKFDLNVENDTAKGVYHSGFFGDSDLKDIEFKDGALHFKVVFNSDQGEFPISYTANLKGDELTGTITTSLGDQENATEFTGTRETTE